MKVYASELKIYQSFMSSVATEIPELSNDQLMQLKINAKKIRMWGHQNPKLHQWLQALPFVAIFLMAIGLYFLLQKLSDNALNPIFLGLILGLGHGILGYQWVIYGMHEGAGHGLFSHPLLRTLAFHSCRLLFADPVHYRLVHQTHHQSLGTENDGAFTHFVLPSRVWRSMLPGAGIFFPNDYQIHQNPKYDQSRFRSDLIGTCFLIGELVIFSTIMPWYVALIALGVIAPWIGMILDRMRETLEHHLMAPDQKLGARELGLGIWGLILGGGPWGQPCHQTHHFAPDLKWYQQILFHRSWHNVLDARQKKYIGLNNCNWAKVFIEQQKSTTQFMQKIGEIL